MSEIAELIAALRAWGPLVSSGHEVPAAGGVMHRAADQLESYQRVAVASGTIMQDQVQALAVAERNATEAAATIATLRERVKVLEAGLAEIDGCFQAAYAEGFIELRSEIEDLPECARLFDVLNRRIMFIEGVARSLLENTDG